MSTLLQDLRFAVRQLSKAPGFALVALSTLALGIGANTAIYSIIHGALRLPYGNASRIVAVENVYPQGSYFANSWPDFQQWRSQQRTFTNFAATFTVRSTWTGAGEPQLLNVGLVSDGYFGVYGVSPILGRALATGDHQKGAAPACLLVADFWRTQFGSDPQVLGKPLNLSGKTCTIVGVMPKMTPEGFRPVQVWAPLELQPPYLERGTNYLFTVGLLRPGVTLQQAQAELRGIQAQIDKQFPGNSHGIDVELLSQQVFGNLRSIMNILLAAVAFILLIACVNLANMLLARGSDREREFAIRRALGASPRRMVRQALTESLLLSVGGAATGLALAVGVIHIPIAAWPKGLQPPSSLHLDGIVLAFTLALGVATGLLFGMIPALRILRQRENAAMQQGRTITESREHRFTRSSLVVAEIALSMLLVAGSLNMAFYFLRLLRVDPGVNPQNVLAMSVTLSPARYTDPAQMGRFYDAVLEKLAALPRVTHVAGTIDMPFTGANANGDFTYEGQPGGTADHNPFADMHSVTPGFFATVQTPLLEGRDFSPQDKAGSPKVAIINRGMAQKLWPGQIAIGKHLHCCFGDGNFVVVGIVGDVRYAGPAAPVGFAIYTSEEQNPVPFLGFLMRTSGDPLALAESARRAVAAIDPEQAVSNITSLEALSQASIAGQRTSTMVTAILGALALLLASVGVYGVIAYSVSRREREFGIRMALGADRGSIGRLLFSGVLRLMVIGVVLGAGLVFAMRAWIDSLIGATGTSPIAMLSAGLLLCAVASLATWVPARRATHVEPMQALRAE
ncbi:MAG: ABC transporter permease [Acidobacteriaceae bacterium]